MSCLKEKVARQEATNKMEVEESDGDDDDDADSDINFDTANLQAYETLTKAHRIAKKETKRLQKKLDALSELSNIKEERQKLVHDRELQKKNEEISTLKKEQESLKSRCEEELKTREAMIKQLQERVTQLTKVNGDMQTSLSNRPTFPEVAIPQDLQPYKNFFGRLDDSLRVGFSTPDNIQVKLTQAVRNRDDDMLHGIEKVSLAFGRKVAALTNEIRQAKLGLGFPQDTESITPGKCQLFDATQFDFINADYEEAPGYVCFEHSSLERDLKLAILQANVGFNEFRVCVCPFHFQVLCKFKQVEIVSYVFRTKEQRFSVTIKPIVV